MGVTVTTLRTSNSVALIIRVVRAFTSAVDTATMHVDRLTVSTRLAPTAFAPLGDGSLASSRVSALARGIGYAKSKLHATIKTLCRRLRFIGMPIARCKARAIARTETPKPQHLSVPGFRSYFRRKVLDQVVQIRLDLVEAFALDHGQRRVILAIRFVGRFRRELFVLADGFGRHLLAGLQVERSLAELVRHAGDVAVNRSRETRRGIDRRDGSQRPLRHHPGSQLLGAEVAARIVADEAGDGSDLIVADLARIVERLALFRQPLASVAQRQQETAGIVVADLRDGDEDLGRGERGDEAGVAQLLHRRFGGDGLGLGGLVAGSQLGQHLGDVIVEGRILSRHGGNSSWVVPFGFAPLGDGLTLSGQATCQAADQPIHLAFRRCLTPFGFAPLGDGSAPCSLLVLAARGMVPCILHLLCQSRLKEGLARLLQSRSRIVLCF